MFRARLRIAGGPHRTPGGTGSNKHGLRVQKVEGGRRMTVLGLYYIVQLIEIYKCKGHQRVCKINRFHWVKSEMRNNDVTEMNYYVINKESFSHMFPSNDVIYWPYCSHTKAYSGKHIQESIDIRQQSHPRIYILPPTKKTQSYIHLL